MLPYIEHCLHTIIVLQVGFKMSKKKVKAFQVFNLYFVIFLILFFINFLHFLVQYT